MMKDTISSSTDLAKLERALIDAYYLGFTLRDYGRNEKFLYAESSAFVADVLLGFSQIMSEKIRTGEKLFHPDWGGH